MAFWKRPTKSAPDFAQLEDRVMLSASPAALATANTSFDGQVDKLTPSTDYVLHVQAPDDDAGDPSYSGLETDQATASRRLDDPHTFRFESSPTADSLRYELVLIDEAAGDYQQLVDDLLNQQSDARQLDIAVLSSDRNGIEQISKILADYDQLDALHIVSHGSNGGVKLGNSSLSLDNVGSYAGQLVGWRDALAADADLLFYGCDLASNEDGQTLVESLGALCDCDVASSDDLTGHEDLGGDWVLEYTRGAIETGVAFSTDLQASWLSVLSTVTFQEGVSGYSGTQDTFIDQDDPTADNGSSFDVAVAEAPGAFDLHGLILFGGIVGSNPGEIPQSVQITSASLQVTTSDLSVDTVSIYRMLQTWSQSSNWNDFGGLTPGGELASTPDDQVIGPSGTVTFTGLESTVQAWVNGESNYGWGITSSANDAWYFDSSENGNPPLLSVTYIDPGSQASTAHTLTVDTANDVWDGDTTSIDALLLDKGADGFISLREAIWAANNTTNFDASTPDVINFAIGTVGSQQTIVLADTLPALTDPVMLDAMTQGGVAYTGNPLIELDGTSTASFSTAGILIWTSDSTARGFIVHSIDDEGFEIDGTSGLSPVNNNLIELNWIGINASQLTDPNGDNGILITGAAAGNTIRNNVIAGNTDTGIQIRNAGSDNNVIEGNIIGLAPDGTTVIPNGTHGIHIYNSANGTRIGTDGNGTDDVLERNIISGNSGSGIYLEVVDGTIIDGNYVGVGSLGIADKGNTSDGITIAAAATNTTIGTAGFGNVISGNTGHGINLTDGSNITIQANTIGANASGTAGIQNDLSAVNVASVQAMSNIQIGGMGSGEGNLIAYNYERGILTSGAGSGDSIQGNTITESGYSGIVSNRTGGMQIIGNYIYTNGTRGVYDEVAIGADHALYHNTIHGSQDDGLSVEGASAVIRNIIITGSAGFGINVNGAGSIATESHNLITDAVTSPANLGGRANVALDASSINVDPLFVDSANGDFTLQETSPARDAGLDLGGSQPDVNDTAPGNYNDSAPDMGAYESTAHPIITLPGGPVGYTENDAATIIDSGATVSDANSLNFDGGTLTVTMTAGATASDVLSIVTGGDVTLNGADVLVSAVIVGTFSNGTGLTPLTINWNADSSPSTAQEVLRQIAYSNTSDDPSTAARTAEFVLTDGDGGTSTAVSETINITAVNDAPVIADWYNPAWLYRKEIIIDAAQVVNDLTEFPVLIDLATDAELASFAQADGDDILFTAADGTFKLPHEIEFFDSGNGQLTAWVKTDLAGGQDTRLYLYYGHAVIGNQQDPINVWDASFEGVWHLNNSPTGAPGEIKDSKGVNDGTTEGAMDGADLVDAKVGKGLDFDEVDDLIRVSDSASLDGTASAATIEAWVWWDNAADGDHQIVMTSSNRFTAGLKDGYEWASQGDGDHFYYPFGGTDPNYVLGPNPFSNQAWHHVAVTQNFATKSVEIYVDGSPMTFTQDTLASTWITLADPADWLWGGNPDRATRYFDGMLDELRVSSAVRSQAWIQTTVNNQDDPSAFLTLGTAESQALSMTDVVEDSTDPPGDVVAAIISSAGGDRITDVDLGAVEGIAVVGVDNSNGTWEYDAGSGWTAFGAATDSSAVLLDPTALVRFVPDPDYVGSAGNLTFRAWDQTDGNSSGATGIDVSINGATAAYSTATDTTSLNVTAVNDAPVVGAPGGPLAATEQVGLAIHGTGFTVSDADEAGSGAVATLSVTEGTITVVAGDSGVTITGENGTGTVTLSGTIAQLDHLLTAAGTGTITYLNTSDTPSASATFTVTVNDQGNTGADPGLSGGPTDEEGTNNVTINIGAVNDDPTNAGSLPSDIAVTEDVASDVDLSPLNLSDVDAGAGSLTVILTTSTGGNLSATSGGGVTVGGSGTGTLTLTGTQSALNTFLDTASNIQYLHGTPGTTGDNADTIQIEITDNGNTGAGGGGAINLGTVNVDIGNFNGAPVITTTNLNAAENQTSAGTVVAADPDVPANTLTWSLTGSGWDDGLFTINSGTGQLTFNSAPDFEVPGDANADNVYEVEVRVNDGTVDTTKLITITVTDSNESPTVNPATFSLAENSISGMSVGIVIAVDPDGGDSLTYTITGGNTGSAFAINSSTGGITVANSAALDFESTPTFNLAVQVADTGGLTDTAAVTINLTDVNEAPVTVDDTFTVSETAANGTLIGIVSGSDADVGQTLSYAITAGDPTNVFAINASTGEITVNDSSQLDILTTPSYTLTVGVTDDGAPPRTSAATITILVTDVNQPPIVNDQSFSIVENAADGASVGTVIFNDPDFFDTHSFFITGGSGATAFAVNVSTGEITVADSSQLDYEVTTSFTLDVVVTDDGSPNRSDSATITVNLHPLNDNVPVGMTESATVVFGESVSVFDSKNSSVLDNDRDADVPADTLTTILNSGPSHAASFTLNPDGTFLYVHDGSDVQIDSFTYRISDGTNTSDPVTVTINIMPLDVPDDSPIDNDPPRDDPPDNEPPDDDPSDDEPPAEVIPPRKVPTPPDRPRPRHPTQRDPSDERREQHGPSVGFPIDGPSEVIGEEGLIFFNTGSDHLSVGFRHSVEVLSDTASDLAAFVDPQLLFEKLNDFQEGLKQNDQAIKLTIGSVAIASLGVTAGYVFWTVKGGYLLASVLSNMPAWRFIDPLPIYDAAAGGYWEDEKEKENVRIS